MSIDEKTLACYDQYERRFAQANLSLPLRRPWLPEDREEIRDIVRSCLGIRDEWIPAIKAENAGSVRQEGFRIERLRVESWPGVLGAAHLYIPEREGPYPFVLLCCGHGAGCKLSPGYQAMARRLARQGAMVLVPDNIGQGERTPMGHGDAVLPFACGTSVQGLIIMETIAWLAWAKADSRVDSSRMAAIGNSGGGTLTLFLGALCPELAVLSSSGYPSTFDFIARKEKKHCHCNILPGIVGRAEMWEILGLFAPKPLFIFQGSEDNLFPCDLFYSTARRVRSVYGVMNAADRFRFECFPGPHPWFLEKRHALAHFLAETLGLDPAEELTHDTAGCLDASAACYDGWPENALTVDGLAAALTGISPRSDLRLWDVYPPAVGEYDPQGFRGENRQIFAQYEAFLGNPAGKR